MYRTLQKIRYYRTDRKRIEGTSRAVLPVIRIEKGGENFIWRFDAPLTNGSRGGILSMKREYQFKCSLDRSQAGEIIENRVQITNGTATVSVEVSA